ncbi:procathepsin L-like [Patiria miniata]|uniref:Cathepsin L n=1 Tax=Patiria miniata TaxID=46514 RepID=A0A914BJY6_PATMI|nr:procathepsin L-like [Patiria miniata]XP_038076122.1 procathepsin L-like [Patiria miniata]
MKFLILALCVAAALATSPDLDQEWQMWKDNNQRKYGAEEEDFRRFVWEYNYKIVTEHNQRYALGHTTYTMAMNEFADLTSGEFTKKMNGFVMDKVPPTPANSFTDVSALPTMVDWRTKGWVTGVKNQMQCGSCWAFSATGSLEGQTFNKTGKLPDISEQNLVDCAMKPSYNCHGCEGGTMNGAFQYVHDNMGIDSESSYPYQAEDKKCRFNPANVVATDKTHTLLPAMDEKALQMAVAMVGPISVAIDASHESFQMYHKGVYDEPMCSQTLLDHGVLAVGYGMEDDKAYWLVKNSWGKKWGMKGYIMMSRFNNNQCGIATNASYPLV